MVKRASETRVDLRGRLPERLSPSRAKDFAQCPKLFYYKTILKLRTPATTATTKGTLAHYAFEKIFELESAARVVENAVPLVRVHWEKLREEENYAEIVALGDEKVEEMLKEAEELVANWFFVEDPKKFTPEGREQWVRGKVGKAPMHGVIDRLDKIEVNGVTYWCISDYKGLALTTKLATPRGWTSMGEVEVGDELIDPQGEPTVVTHKSEIHWRDCYEIVFRSGERIVADDEHRWVAEVKMGASGIWEELELTSAEMAVAWGEGLGEIRIKATQPLAGEYVDEVSPGQLVRWGEMAGKAGASRVEEDEISGLESIHWWVGEYLRASRVQREEALEALMSGASNERAEGVIGITLESEETAREVAELIASLGGVARVVGSGGAGWRVVGERAQRGPVYHQIAKVAATETVATACIQVDSESEMFLAGVAMVPTHNTGKVPNPTYIEDSFFGMNVYAALLEDELGIRAESLRLVFVKNASKNDIFKQKVTDDSLNKIRGTMDSIWESINKAARAGDFKPKKSKLCGWCHFQDICPAFHPELEGLSEDEIVSLGEFK